MLVEKDVLPIPSSSGEDEFQPVPLNPLISNMSGVRTGLKSRPNVDKSDHTVWQTPKGHV